MSENAVLILSDDPLVDELITTVVEACGLMPLLTGTRDAFEAALRCDVSMVILSICVPRFDGVEAINALVRKAINVPLVVLCSGDPTMRGIVVKYGEMMGFQVPASLPNPVDADQLRDAVAASRNLIV